MKEPTGELSAPSEMPDNTAPCGRAGSQPQVTADAGASGNAARTNSGPAVSNDQAAVSSGGNGSPLDEVAGPIGTQEVTPGSTADIPRRSHSLDSSRTQEWDAALEDAWATMSKAQENILAMERGLMEKFRKFLVPEHTDTTPIELRNSKGKNVDPRNWGDANLNEEEIDPEMQQAPLEEATANNHNSKFDELHLEHLRLERARQAMQDLYDKHKKSSTSKRNKKNRKL